MTQRQLFRDDFVRLFLIKDNQFEGRNKRDDVVLDADGDYFIYMSHVNFKKGNIIEGTYMGDLTENSILLDDKCKNVSIDGNNFTVDGKQVKTAPLVAINNKTKVVIIVAHG